MAPSMKDSLGEQLLSTATSRHVLSYRHSGSQTLHRTLVDRPKITDLRLVGQLEHNQSTSEYYNRLRTCLGNNRSPEKRKTIRLAWLGYQETSTSRIQPTAQEVTKNGTAIEMETRLSSDLCHGQNLHIER